MVGLKEGSRPPWVGLGAAVWVQIAVGNSFCFPLYSPTLKSVLGINQQQLTILGVAIDIGENVGIIPGIACNKFPPWVVLLVGVFASFLGYGVLWLAVSRIVQSLPFWVVSFFDTFFSKIGFFFSFWYLYFFVFLLLELILKFSGLWFLA